MVGRARSALRWTKAAAAVVGAAWMAAGAQASARPGAPAAGGAEAAVPAAAGAPEAIPGARDARLRLLGTRPVRKDVTRYHYRYGPLVAAPGQNLILVGPVPLGSPAVVDSYTVRTKPSLVRSDGVPPAVEQVHMHHAVFFNLSRRDATDPSLPERFFAFAEEKTIGEIPMPYGYPMRATDVLGVNYMLHNGTPQAEVVHIDLEIDFVSAASETGRAMRPARPLWLDVRNGSAYPVFDVRRGSGTRGRFTYPDDEQGAYEGRRRLNEWTVDRDGVLVAGAGHLHPGGLHVDLDLRRGDRRTLLFRSEANYFDPNGPVSWDMAMDYTPRDWRAGVRRGDVLSVRTEYETERASWYESMGIFLVFMADGAPEPDPFQARIATDGQPSHGPLPEARNHGGQPTGLPDPRTRPDGATVADGVGIAGFAYWPGDMSLSGGFGAPPVVAPGSPLRFGNFDAAAGIPHTVTACRAPCTGRTGVSYPLADGEVDFDSAQLGYGMPNFTAAAQRPDWTVPAGLRPGTYTYFCRVHPFMRGAFRVPGRVDPPAAPARRGRAARVRVRGGRLKVRGRAVRVRVGCEGTEGRCRGALRVVVPGRRRPVVLARGRYSLPAGQARSFELRLTRDAARRVRRARRGLAVRVEAAPVGGAVLSRAARLLATRRR